ncbi:MAG: DUF4157 domain-containing protein [Okeania sp. SIO3H1]|nr:DUF4157 domain-containing protein [Okeania sp. SIO3H1]
MIENVMAAQLAGMSDQPSTKDEDFGNILRAPRPSQLGSMVIQPKFTVGRPPSRSVGELGNQLTAPRPSNKLGSVAIQPKLKIGKPNDAYEQEADRVAKRVVDEINAPASVQRQTGKEELQMKPQSSAIKLLGMREKKDFLYNPKEPMLQRKRMEEGVLLSRVADNSMDGMAGGETSADFESAIASARGSGQPLDSGLQAQMDQAMGADFTGVRVHTDFQSDQLNQLIQAKAFTTGQDVFFKKGEYQPKSRRGQELIAHELTHVVQQGGVSQIQRQSINDLAPELIKEMEEEGGALIQAKFHSLRQIQTPVIQRAYIARRPLGGWLRGIGPMSGGAVFKDKGIFHEHIFFEDGNDPANIGFMGKNGLGQDNAANYTIDNSKRNLDDAIMRQAVDGVGDPGNYNILGNNCQRYVRNVYERYLQLGGQP